ncbi:MAG TPA: phenylalanine--tRNA ligase subunit beta [Campylobacterales bacterium]|nr:phenylalanine--tRNA ligase subunit beta [Campylobacterales bacterium]
MIFTRSWLSEFINISHITDKEIIDTLNKTGIEVAAFKKMEIPKGVVVGKIIDFEKHPDADKLSVCKVDSGSGELTIVCGAKNVKKGAYVALATIGAKLPNGVEIKEAELRGVPSFGMLCSSVEIGAPKTNDGIMILDNSVKNLKIGEELSNYAQIADSVFEVEITPNRGDCLSVRGIAREIAAYYGLELREFDTKKTKQSEKGIGRILSLHAHLKTTANAAFMVFEHTDFEEQSFLIEYRLALIGEKSVSDKLKNLTTYISHSVGVNLSFFGESAFNKSDEKIDLHLDVLDGGVEVIRGKKNALYIGLRQCKESEPTVDDKNIILAASYIAPSVVLELKHKLEDIDDTIFHRSSRGSEPDLILGLNYASNIMSSFYGFLFYVGYEDDFKPVDRELIKVDISKINKIIGVELDKNHIVGLLRKLYFSVNVNIGFDSCVVGAPSFRHDIANVYDLAEEIVRIKGIDSIVSAPIMMQEAPRLNDSLKNYRFLKNIRQNAAAKGFFEAVHFIFADRALQEKFGFESLKEEEDLLNPITSELNTLRSTLLLNILNSASKNANNSQNRIALFESGVVFDANRGEKTVISFVWANDAYKDSVINSGKPKAIDFQTFISKLADIFGGFELTAREASGEFLHPYQSANIIKDGVNIGFAAKLHKNTEDFFGLRSCFVCEIELSKLSQTPKKAAEFSKFQKSVRDLSIGVSGDFSYAPIRKCLESVKNPLLKSFYPIDVYKPNNNESSITIRLELQANDRTLEEKDISAATNEALEALQNELQIGLKQ